MLVRKRYRQNDNNQRSNHNSLRQMLKNPLQIMVLEPLTLTSQKPATLTVANILKRGGNNKKETGKLFIKNRNNLKSENFWVFSNIPIFNF